MNFEYRDNHLLNNNKITEKKEREKDKQNKRTKSITNSSLT